MIKGNKLDELNEEFLRELDEEDPFGFNEEDKTTLFKCINCGEEDDVPDFVVQEFLVDKKRNEEVETLCFKCGGTMRRAKKDPK